MKSIFKFTLSILVTFLLCASAVADNTGSQLYEKYKSSVVRVWAGGHGTGFIINEEGYILTNAHVTALSQKQVKDGKIEDVYLTGSEADALVKDKERYYVVLQEVDGKPYAYKAKLVAERRELDLAIIQIVEPAKLKNNKPIPFASEDAKIKSDLFTIGHSGLNDDKEVLFKLGNYLGLTYFSPEEQEKYIKSTIIEGIKNIEDESIRKKAFNYVSKALRNQASKEESEWAEKEGLIDFLCKIVENCLADIYHYSRTASYSTFFQNHRF